jgi:CRP/FNR family transcriptional regulator
VLPFARLERVCAEHPQAQRSLHRAIGAQIAREQGMLQLPQRSAATQRIAAFLLGWGLRMQARGFSRDEFQLRITQRALAAFLNLRPETLNRALHSLQKAGLLSFSARQVQIQDRDALLRLIDDDEAAARLAG